MIVPSLLLISSLAAAAFAAPGHQHTVPQLEIALDAVNSDIGMLNTKIQGLTPTGGTAQLAPVTAAVTMLLGGLNNATVTATATGKLGESDGVTIFARIQNDLPGVSNVFESLCTKKTDFENMGPAVVKGIVPVLNSLFKGATALAVALTNICPTDLQMKAQEVMKDIDVAFNKADACFA